MNFIRKLIEPFSGGYAAHPNEFELSNVAGVLQHMVFYGLQEGVADELI
jgi:hypothetical protein